MTVDVPSAPPLATVPGVELVQAGQWDLSSGPVTFTRGDLASAVAALDCPAVRQPVLKLGHTDPRFDGEPAVGWVANVSLADSGMTVVGDYTGMPGWLGDVLASAYPDRSIEGFFDFRCQLGHLHPFVLTAVALLGVSAPGVGTLESLQDVAALYGVHAAADQPGEPVAVTVHAKEGTMPNPRPTEVAAGVTSEDVRRAYYERPGVPYSQWICEMQLDPLQLITVDDESGQYARVPITLDGDTVSFGDAVPVVVQYVDKPQGQKTAASALVFASRAESRPEPVNAAEGIKRVAAASAVSDKPWSDFSQADYTIEQWRRACIVGPDSPSENKADYKLPVKEPDGTLNRNAIHAAAGRVGQLDPASARQAAAKKLVSLYKNQLKEDPPQALTDLAGGTAASAAPETPPAEPDGETPKEGETMALDKGLRERLGLAEDADEDTILTALDDALNPSGNESEQEEVAAQAPALPEGTVAIDEATLAELRTQAAEGVAARAQQRTEARDRALDDAIRAGKFPPARREHWAKYYDADPEGARQTLASLADGIVPIEDKGAPGGEQDSSDAFDAEFDRMFPPHTIAKG